MVVVTTMVGVLGILLVHDAGNVDFIVIAGKLVNLTEHTRSGVVAVTVNVDCDDVTELPVTAVTACVSCVAAVTECAGQAGLTELLPVAATA